jgi:predicted transcriptional regulator
MKALYIIIAAMLFTIALQAKTYIIGSGKWSDPILWENEYWGCTIQKGDVVIITGHVVITSALLIQGTLQIEKGASIIGMKDLNIGITGRVVNNGNIIVKNIINEGSIENNMTMEAMTNIASTGAIENYNNIIAGNNFEIKDGEVSSTKGGLYANNKISLSSSTSLSLAGNFYCPQ